MPNCLCNFSCSRQCICKTFHWWSYHWVSRFLIIALIFLGSRTRGSRRASAVQEGGEMFMFCFIVDFLAHVNERIKGCLSENSIQSTFASVPVNFLGNSIIWICIFFTNNQPLFVTFFISAQTWSRKKTIGCTSIISRVIDSTQTVNPLPHLVKIGCLRHPGASTLAGCRLSR